MSAPETVKQPALIGFCGRAGSGKDTAARFLADLWREQGHAVALLAFADPIRDMLHARAIG